MSNLKGLTDWNKLAQLMEEQAESEKLKMVDEKAMFQHLQNRVKGQDEILQDVSRLICLQMGKKSGSRPLCNLLFLGPTGTGKTELAKAIAEYLFGDEKQILRFDCSELMNEASKWRLVGSAPGFQNSRDGGQLTRPILTNPRRVILFDEIEKANSVIFDLFLQMMGEARLTEQGSGKVADFSHSIIILTSNADADKVAQIKGEHSDYHEMLNAIKVHLSESQIFRPEIVGRIDRIYVFNPIQGMIVAEIAMGKLQKLAREYGIELEFVAPELIINALKANQKISRFGIRELERILFDMFAPAMSEARNKKVKKIKLHVEQDGQIKMRGK